MSLLLDCRRTAFPYLLSGMPINEAMSSCDPTPQDVAMLSYEQLH